MSVTDTEAAGRDFRQLRESPKQRKAELDDPQAEQRRQDNAPLQHFSGAGIGFNGASKFSAAEERELRALYGPPLTLAEIKDSLKAAEAVLEQARLVYTAATRTRVRLTTLEASVLHTKALLQYQELLVVQEQAILAKGGAAK